MICSRTSRHAKQFSKQKFENWNAELVTNEIKQGCVLSEHRDEAVHRQAFACNSLFRTDSHVPLFSFLV